MLLIVFVKTKLADWCAGVGPVLFEPDRPADSVPPLDRLAIVTWNTHVGGGAVDDLIDRVRGGLYILRRAREMAGDIGYPVHTKSSLMVGLGETRSELTEAFEALRGSDVDILTIGQYLRPSEKHLPLIRYYHPEEFAEMKGEALSLGFKHVESGPLVRSSYHARDQVPGAELRAIRRRASVDADGRVAPAAS